MVNQSAYIVASLEDKKSKALGNIISNEKTRAILNLLTKKNATESEIASELGMPLSTVNYNIKSLLKAGMINIKGFYYSKKGNKINVYTLAKKLILIAPKGISLARSKIKTILPTVLIAAAVSGIIKLFYSIQSRTYAQATLAEGTREVAEKAVETVGAISAAQQILVSTYHALFFLFGALFALGIYLLFSWRKK